MIAAFAAEVALFQRVAGREAADALRAPSRSAIGDADPYAIRWRHRGAAIETHAATARFPSIRALVDADLRGWLPITGVSLSDAVIEATLAEADGALARTSPRRRWRRVISDSAHVLRATLP